MQTIKLNLPDFVNVEERELNFILATKLFEDGKLSMGQAAKLAGVTKRAFLELAGDYGISIFNQTANELEKDLLNA